MESSLYLSTGKAARALGVNADAIRRLCDAGAIQAETTFGGQWRIPTEEIDRLKEEGMPPLPKPMPGQSKRGAPSSAPVASPPPATGPAVLLADPSEATIAAADEVVRLENEVRALGLKRQREEALDWFRAREEQEDMEAAELEAEEDAARVEEEEHERLLSFRTRWLEYALASLPGEAQGQVELEIHRKVKAALAAIDPHESETVVRRIVDGVVANVLRPWLRQEAIEATIVDAVRRLPYVLRGISEPTTLERRAIALAVEAVDRLGASATMQEVERAAEDAVKKVEAEFHEHRAVEADAAEREWLVRWVALELREFTPEDRELALQAVHGAWAALPVGTSRAVLSKARDTALAPFRGALAQRREVQRLEAELARKREWKALEAQVRKAGGSGLPTTVRRAGPDPKPRSAGHRR